MAGIKACSDLTVVTRPWLRVAWVTDRSKPGSHLRVWECAHVVPVHLNVRVCRGGVMKGWVITF